MLKLLTHFSLSFLFVLLVVFESRATTNAFICRPSGYICAKKEIDPSTGCVLFFQEQPPKFYQFKKKIRDAEKARVTKIIREMLPKDSFLSTKAFNQALNDSIRHLQKRLDQVGSFRAKNDTVIRSQKDTIISIKTQQAQLALDSLVEKLLPILQKREAQDKLKENRYRRLNQIRLLLATQKPIRDTVLINDSLRAVITSTYIQKASLFGYHPHNDKSNYQNYHYPMIGTLAYFASVLDGKTGELSNAEEWENAEVIDMAQNANCRVVLTVRDSSVKSQNAFFSHPTVQKKFITNVLQLLEKRNVSGVNLMFEQLEAKNKKAFVKLVARLRKSLKTDGRNYELIVRLPCYDSTGAFDMKGLDSLTDRFVVDFSRTNFRQQPIAPIRGGRNSVQGAIENLIKKGISPKKLIACLPYQGILWDIENPKSQEYILYNSIRKDYEEFKRSYTDSAAAYINIESEDKDTVLKIWFEDEVTLGKKYDYLLQAGVGGIGIWALGFDEGREELWDLLMDKLYDVKTLRVDTIPPKKIPVAKRSFWQSVKHELKALQLLYSDPCLVNIDEIHTDEIIQHWAPLMAILLVLVCGIYIYNIRFKGLDWSWKKPVLALLIVLVIFDIVCFLLYIFLDEDYSIIGFSKSDNCHMTSLKSVLYLVGIGFICGLLVMRFLVMPLMQDDEED